MPDVPPEIATLHDLAFDVTEEGWESCSATSCVSVEHAEAAVLACEQRMQRQIDRLDRLIETEREGRLSPSDVLAERQRTVAEIVEALRAEFQRFSEDSMATDYDLAMRDGWIYAADLIEQRFGGEKGEQT